jgi:hypothetical protein
VPGSQQPIEPSQASQFALQGLQTKPHCIIRIILNLGNYGAELMLSISFASASPLGAYCNSAINGFGDHALFPEECMASGGRSVMFVECDDVQTLKDPFTPYELGEDIILDTRPFYQSFSTAAGPGLISSRFVSLFMLGFEAPMGENILVALIAHNHKMAVATHSGFHCSRQVMAQLRHCNLGLRRRTSRWTPIPLGHCGKSCGCYLIHFLVLHLLRFWRGNGGPSP